MTRGVDPFAAAVEFLAVPGRAERVLGAHHDDGRGRCAGCCTCAVPWPCVVARLARHAITGRRPPSRTGANTPR